MLVDEQHLYHQLDQMVEQRAMPSLRKVHALHGENWPSLRHQALGSLPYQCLSISEWTGLAFSQPPPKSSKANVVVFIDDWLKARALACPILLQSNSQEMERVIFLDRSGTMKQGSTGEANALAQSYEFLTRQRQLETLPWRILSFSDDCVDHGLWSFGDPAPMSAFSSSRGHTRLLEALEGFISKDTHARTIIVLSDGKIDTRHEESIQRSLAKWKGQGQQLHLLSPQGKPLPDWKTLYEQKWLHDNWPDSKVNLPPGEMATDILWGLNWSGVVASQALKSCTPILVDKAGRPLLYLQSHEGGNYFFATGLPQAPQVLLDKLKSHFQARPVVRLSEKTLEIDVGTPSLEALKILPNAESLLPFQPGLYRIDLDQRDSFEFFHSNTGPFSVENLSSWNKALDKHHPPSAIAAWSPWSWWNSVDGKIHFWTSLVLLQLGWVLFCCFPQLITSKLRKVLHAPHR